MSIARRSLNCRRPRRLHRQGVHIGPRLRNVRVSFWAARPSFQTMLRGVASYRRRSVAQFGKAAGMRRASVLRPDRSEGRSAGRR